MDQELPDGVIGEILELLRRMRLGHGREGQMQVMARAAGYLLPSAVLIGAVAVCIAAIPIAREMERKRITFWRVVNERAANERAV